tara:strand:- start:79 stop:453 length:375 start_codon:yes stop_codon:yes gene_type:complete
MEEGNEQENYRDEIFSKSVRAGKRTYFFDVKSTKGKDLYLTITESKKRFNDDGKFFFEKHKLFLYKEDFDKFEEGFREALEAISKLKESGEYPDLKSDNFNDKNEEVKSDKGGEGYTDVNFDDL